MERKMGLLLLVLYFISKIDTLNWQGTGNLNQENRTVIWSYINKQFDLTWEYQTVANSGNTQLIDFATGLSDHLNAQWSVAWNVVVVYAFDGNWDTVIYGYAFKDHWMWYNGIKMDDDYYVSLIIWKDYNCLGWFSINGNDNLLSSYPGTYSGSALTAMQNLILNLRSSLDRRQVWLAAQATSDKLHSDSQITKYLGANKAFTVIVSQSYNLSFYARVCAKGWLANYQRVGNKGGDGSGKWGQQLILQLR